MTKAKQQLVTLDLLKKVLTEALGLLEARINKRFDEQDVKITNLQFDVKDIRRDQKEMKKQQDTIEASVLSLDKRVRYQDDFPERLVQAERDIHNLKREVFHLKAK